MHLYKRSMINMTKTTVLKHLRILLLRFLILRMRAGCLEYGPVSALNSEPVLAS